MKQQPSCLKVFAATASSLVLRIDSSPRWRASKDLLCSQSYPNVLLTYLTCSSVIRGCLSTEHGSKPQVCSAPEFLGATALHVPCCRIWPWHSPTCRRGSDRARGSSLACSMPLADLPFPLWSKHNRRWLHLGVAEAQEILERRAGVGESQHNSYLSLPPVSLPAVWSLGVLGGNTWFLGKTTWLQVQLFEMFLSFTFQNLRTQIARGSNQHWNLAPVSYTAVSSTPASDTNKAAQQS